MEPLPDLHYIQQVLQGKQAAFATLVDRYRNMVYAIAWKISGNEADAEDVAQEAFLKAYQSLGRYKGDAAFSTWLYRIAYNHAVDRQRQQLRKQPAISLENLANEPDAQEAHPGERLDAQARSEKIRETIERLPPEDRTIILLYYYEQHPIREIASVVGLSENHVKVKLHRIRATLSRWLQPHTASHKTIK